MPKPKLAEYIWAMAMSGAVVAFKLYIPDVGGQTPYLLGSFAVVLSAFFGGFGPGLFAAGFTAVAMDWFFSDPIYNLAIANISERIQLLFYLLQGVLMSWLIGKFRETQMYLDEMNLNLEKLIEKRTRTLQKVNDELERSNRELEDFAYVASHDLQEPLRKIQSFGNLLTEELGEDMTDDGELYLDRMLKSAERMRVLINDLLAYSRVTTKAKPFMPVDLRIVIEEVLDNLESRIQETKADVQVESLPMVTGDESQVRQLMQNLLSNALKFHKPNVSPKIRIYTPESNALGVRWAVEDNGIGIPEAYHDKIFTMFQRLHGRSNFSGTGIGLAVVKKIVDRHGGQIEVISREDEGTTFVVTFPERQRRGGAIT